MRAVTGNDLQHDAVAQGLDDHHQTVHSMIDKPDADIEGYAYFENSVGFNDADSIGDREENTLNLTSLDTVLLLEVIPDLQEETADVFLSALYSLLQNKGAATMCEHGSGIEGFNRFKKSLSGKEELVKRLILEYEEEEELYTDSSESMSSSESDEGY